ncbi:MAG TPA: hypothetical protein PK536_08375 [Ignavibacteria bacterium]|nr:hypothetical protein [Bacteroidota bacterium]HRI85448.1 hypothetical protein [Ignavibacteria bacterium]HRJ98792.1 hypothetical protein [Ignavibacteria bacterium]
MTEQITKEISRTLIEDISPDELEYFDELSDAHFKRDVTDKDAQLGFGFVEFGELATPAVMTLVSGIVTYLLTDVVKVAKDQMNETIKEKLKGFFSKKKKLTENNLTLSKEQLEKITGLIDNKLREIDVNEKTALKIRDSLISSFVLGK